MEFVDYVDEMSVLKVNLINPNAVVLLPSYELFRHAMSLEKAHAPRKGITRLSALIWTIGKD
jgi:hypothetical protein